MPVIRGPSRTKGLSNERRKTMLDQLINELDGISSKSGSVVFDIPLIFEIPLEMSDRMDVLVVWDAFRDVRSEDRTALILDAYRDQAPRIAQALGVSLEEASEQGLLPYSIRSTARHGEIDEREVNQAMLEVGGFQWGNWVELLFPTKAMANHALVRLYERLPKGAWAIAESIPTSRERLS